MVVGLPDDRSDSAAEADTRGPSKQPNRHAAWPAAMQKTTLARELVDESSINYFDLEDPASLARLEEPMTALRSLKGLVVIDEVQRRGSSSWAVLLAHYFAGPLSRPNVECGRTGQGLGRQ